MSDKFIRYNIAFKPPEEVAKAAISLSRKIGQKYAAFFVLDGSSFHPHITIYSPEYPEANKDKVLKSTEEIANHTKRIKFIFKRIKPYQGFVGIHFELSPEIKDIHKRIVGEINPFREGHIRDKYKTDDFKMSFSEEEQRCVVKYGYANAMELYDSHMTIIRLKDELLAEKVARNLKWEISEFIIDKIGIYTMGGHGVCKKLVGEFSLKTGQPRCPNKKIAF